MKFRPAPICFLFCCFIFICASVVLYDLKLSGVTNALRNPISRETGREWILYLAHVQCNEGPVPNLGCKSAWCRRF